VTAGGLVLATVIQLGVFLAPLVLAQAGFVSGEIAGLVAITGWFVVGMPLSYAVADNGRRRQALRIAHERNRHASVSAGGAIVSSS
jgi:hypothetical protein